ncbi:MAG: hypothetical protein KDD56_00650 [Bdellovibrionales bacterium]|nr:hypothetical protein [Bdellovibrionales bacterium]
MGFLNLPNSFEVPELRAYQGNFETSRAPGIGLHSSKTILNEFSEALLQFSRSRNPNPKELTDIELLLENYKLAVFSEFAGVKPVLKAKQESLISLRDRAIKTCRRSGMPRKARVIFDMDFTLGY